MRKLRDIPEPWRSFLAELDEKATAETRLDCMGGFVVSMEYGFSRETADLDVLVIAPREQVAPLLELGKQGGPLHKKYKVYLDHVGVAKVPDGYEERLREMFPGTYKHLRLCALDAYDLALSKLERNIQRDRDDVKHLARSVPLDLKVLEERYQQELRWQLGNREREDLTLKLWMEMIKEEISGQS
ncbi:MAG TPA: DUF6036 family nucleotidyltransferase [Candidatus Dormibacteraeota bacterium]|jgi:hypothetical protein|nr:DUF6036 family nucleotidyltransferase [Candidatus Dormibacteraeota bacterium]